MSAESHGYERFFAEAEPKLRRSLVAAMGGDAGRSATFEALSWAWENWPKVESMRNPVGYLYRLGRNTGRRRVQRVEFFAPNEMQLPWIEPSLPRALGTLSEKQRICVVLIHGYEWTFREVADLLGTSISTIQSHVDRGLAKLRRELEVAEWTT
jgi:DNA-directed RNA polymerase specialized sigma24 family protein